MPAYQTGGFYVGLMGALSYSLYSSTDGTSSPRPGSGTANMDGMGSGKTGGSGGMSGSGSAGGSMGGMNMARAFPAVSGASSTMSSSMLGMDDGVRETTRAMGGAFLGYHFSRHFGASIAADIGASYREDGSTIWMTDLTLMKLTYRLDGLSASASFALMSDMMQDASSPGTPALPFFGFAIQYVFGNDMILPGPSGSCMSR